MADSGHSPGTPHCALARLMPDAMDTEAVKRSGWRDHGILVVALNDPRLSKRDRVMVAELGKHLYGETE